jgi:hypothetical protein
MSDISVSTTAYQVENRSWLLSPHGTDPGTTPSITLDISAFTAASHYPDGFIPSGIVLGRITATGLYAPYDNAFDADPATAGQQGDGREVAAGLLFSAVKVPNTADTTIDVGGALLVHGFVNAGRLPIAAGIAGGGFLDAAGQADLPLIHFATGA